MATLTKSSAQRELHTADLFERIYPRHRKRLKAEKAIKMVLTDPLLNSQPKVVTERGLTCIETDKHNQVISSKSPDLKSNQRRNQPENVSQCYDVFSPTGNSSSKEDDPLIGQLTSAELNHCEAEEQCQLPLCDTFRADTFQMTNRTLLESMSITISSSTLHSLSSHRPTSTNGSASSYSPDLLIAKSWRLRFLSNHRHLSSCRSPISVIKYLLLLLPIWFTFVPNDTIEQRHSFSIFAQAAKGHPVPTPLHPFFEAIHKRPLELKMLHSPLEPSVPLASTGASISWRPNLRSKRPQTDLQPSDTVHYETYQNAQPMATIAPNYLLSLSEDVNLADQEPLTNQTMELSKSTRPVIKSYPISDHNQLYCDQNIADFDKNTSDSLPDDSLIQQRIIVESEQLELFLRLKPSSSLGSSSSSTDDNDRLIDDFRLQTTTTTAPNGADDLEQQRRRAQCQDMLQAQLEKDLSANQNTPKRPLFELSTSTFNVSCHVVSGPQFQCVLFTFNMHHFGSIFKSNKEPYCSFTFVRFNLNDNRCQLSLIMKRIDPYKGNQHSSTSSRTKNPHNSKMPLPVTSTIWDLFQEIPPIMLSFTDQNETAHPASSPLSIDTPILNNIGEQCATMCQKVYGDKSKLSSNHQIRKQFNPNELIVVENIKPRCLMQFDQTFARAKLKSKHSKTASGSNGSGNSNSGASSSLTSMTSNGNSNSGSNSNDNKKICVESSRHILTHNGLVIKHPTLRIVPVPSADLQDIVEGQTLAPLEFYLKLDSKNMTSNAQYFDLVLKKYKWSASASLLYPDIYPGILTGVSTVSVQSIHHHQNLQHPDLASNAYFRFVFNNLKITKWGYRYLLKISLRSNPTCYTIETTYGPFDVRAHTPAMPATTAKGENSSTSNEMRFVWTTSKCHTVKVDLQASVVLDRGSSQMFSPSSSGSIVPSVPTSRSIDYLCELNIEKLSTFLINFLANRASAFNGDLLPAQLRLSGSMQSGAAKSKLKKQFNVKRNFGFTNEHDYNTLVSNFVEHNRFAINGSQCLEMSIQSKNFSLIETTSSTNHSSIISEMFQSYYQSFHNYQKQQLNQRLINMTFIYSSELLLKIKQVYIDDEPLYKQPPPPPPPSTKAPPVKVKTNKGKSKPSNKQSPSDESNRNVGKRKTENSPASEAEEIDDDDESDRQEEPERTSSAVPPPATATQSSKPVIDRSRKNNGKPDIVSPKGADANGSRSRSKVAQGKSTPPPAKTTPKLVFGSRKDKTKTTTPSSKDEENEASSSERSFLSGRPLLWIAILFANTLLVFGFIILFAICYYKKMLSDEKSGGKGAAGRKPLKRFVKQPGEKAVAGVGSSEGDLPGDVKPLKDDIFMLEKTDYSSGSSVHELDSHDHLAQHRRQSQFQRNGSSSLPYDSEGGHIVPAMRSSAQKVQHLNRVIGGAGGGGGRRMSSMPPSEGESFQHISRVEGGSEAEGGGTGSQTIDLNTTSQSAAPTEGRESSPLVKISIDEVEDSKDSGNEEEDEGETGEQEEIDEDPAVETSLPIIIEEDAEDGTSHTSWLPLPGALPPDGELSPRHSSKHSSPSGSRHGASFLHPNAPFFNEPIEEEEDEEGADSPDLNYNLRGDLYEDRKYYIYKVRDVNMIPKKECVGKVVVPAGTSKNKKAGGGVTLEELRQLIRHSEDEALQDAAKQRFRYLSESYHLVALDESFTSVDQLYPSQGVFIKLDNEHPFSKARVDNSLTARLQAEYERRFGPIAPRRPRKSSIKHTRVEMLTATQGAQSAMMVDDPSKSIYDDPIPFNSQAIRDQFERQKATGRKPRRSLSNLKYDSMDIVNGQYRDARSVRDSAAWNPKAHQAWGAGGSRASISHQQRYSKGQRPPWRF